EGPSAPTAPEAAKPPADAAPYLDSTPRSVSFSLRQEGETITLQPQAPAPTVAATEPPAPSAPPAPPLPAEGPSAPETATLRAPAFRGAPGDEPAGGRRASPRHRAPLRAPGAPSGGRDDHGRAAGARADGGGDRGALPVRAPGSAAALRGTLGARDAAAPLR